MVSVEGKYSRQDLNCVSFGSVSARVGCSPLRLDDCPIPTDHACVLVRIRVERYWKRYMRKSRYATSATTSRNPKQNVQAPYEAAQDLWSA